MATDIYLTIAQLNTLFQTLVMTMIGLDPAVSTSAYAVRISWPTGGAPSWKNTEDICFLRIVEKDDEYNRQREAKFDAARLNQITTYTRVIEVSFVFYGPNSFDHAQTVRDQIFYQKNHDTLALQNIYLIPDIHSPKRAPELFQGNWWERTDMSMDFNELIVRNSALNSATSVAVDLYDDNGLERVINATQ